MKGSPGEYLYVSPGSTDVCGLFLVAPTDQLVAIEFVHFDVDCEDDGLVVVSRLNFKST